jgi:tRNA(fMet)-specific endonuclease VapC
MIILDSDHLSILQHPESPQYEKLTEAMRRAEDVDFATTVVSLEEQMRGWLAVINRAREIRGQIPYYRRLTGIVGFYSRWRVAPFDERAAELFLGHRRSGIRIGTMDLKIAAIAQANDALLLTANLRDFEKVPKLRTETWI